jgi:elongation factor Ts
MTELIKKLREQTGAGIMDVKKALDEAKGDADKALAILKSKGLEVVGKKSARATSQGRIESYVHGMPPTVGALVELLCETDFVAKNEEFGKLTKELAMQVASMNPASTNELLKQEYIREPGKTVQDLLHEAIGKFGENIRIGRFVRYKLGEE